MERLRINFYRTKTALQYEYNPENQSIFFTATNALEGTERRYDWENRGVAKLGMADVGPMLAVLAGELEGLGSKGNNGKYSGLFHENANGNSVINLAFQEDGYWNGLSKQPKDGEPNKWFIKLDYGESHVLRNFLLTALSDMMRNTWTPNSNQENNQRPSNNDGDIPI